MKISDKRLQEIKRVDFIGQALRKYYPNDNIAGDHWVYTPTDMWSKDELILFDMLSELEDKIKDEIIKIIER